MGLVKKLRNTITGTGSLAKLSGHSWVALGFKVMILIANLDLNLILDRLRLHCVSGLRQSLCLLANSFTLPLFVINTYTVFVSQ
jgi:hypothetical protein